METTYDNVDGHLAPWPEVEGFQDWAGILLGNGSSLAVWEDFKYPSLYEKAKSFELTHRLSPEDELIFSHRGTTNFEDVLEALSTTQSVNNVFGVKNPIISERYDSIRAALVEAVRAVHISWNLMPDKNLNAIRRELTNYKVVYSTNYDLIDYWAIMSDGSGTGFDDFFRTGVFDVTTAIQNLDNNRTKVLYLHGGLHLYRFPSGGTRKRSRQASKDLLTLFGEQWVCNGEEGYPLFISEGTPQNKLSSIHRSDYLFFGYSQLARHVGPLVIFGHSLGDSDSHLVQAIRTSKPPVLAVSLLPEQSMDVIRRKVHYHECFPDQDLLFFDATTHPLGKSELRVAKPSIAELTCSPAPWAL